MAAADDLRALNGAPSQRDRLLAAPAPERVKVDGRSLADLLAFAADYGRLITFYGLDDKPHGDWSVFFDGDPSIEAARRASLDPTGPQAEFDQVIADLRNATTFDRRLELLGLAIALILRLAALLVQGRGEAADLERVLAALIASDRRDLLADPARRLALHLGGNSPEYGLRRDRDDWFPALIELLEALFAAMMTALGQELRAALDALADSFDEPDHPPQSGLYDAFAKLFGHAQNSINRFPARLVQFYQSEVLHQTSHPGTPDRLTLTFTPAKDVANTEVPRGTRFLAGTDADGESIAYALDSALTVDAASVAALRTLTVSSEKVVPDGPRVPVQVFSGTVALADKAPRIATPFPLFGATSTGTSGVLTTAQATLGFAVASPTLMLTGGTRAVTLGLTIAPAGLAELMATLEAWGAAAGGIAPEIVFRTVIEAAFTLRYSTAGGWVDVASYQATPPAAGYPLFALTFVLDGDADPFVALSTKPAAADAVPPADGSPVPAPDMPTLVAGLRQDPVALGGGVSVYPYSLLAGMELSALLIDVEVIGLANLQPSTPSGPVDTSQPFLIFGSPPVQGATLDIAAPELFAKRMDGFEVALEWFGLPVTTTGFSGYYWAYVVNADGETKKPGSLFDNRSFVGRLTVVNPGLWSVSDAPQYLFRTVRRDPVPAPDGALRPELLLVTDVETREPPPYYDPALSAIRLSLDQPDTAFGNVLYAANVMAASVRLTAAASACAQQCGDPNGGGSDPPPLTAVIAANATAPDAALEGSVKAAVQRAVANLDGAALKAIEDAIDAGVADPAARQAWRDDLSAALGEPKPGSWLRRLFPWFARAPDFAKVHDNLRDWLAANAAAFAPPDSALVEEATALLDAASELLAVRAEAAGQPPSVSRPVIAARLRDVQTRLADAPGDTSDCIEKCMRGTDLLGFPNQPWLPMASSLTVNYTASAAIPPAADASATFFHLLPFDGVEEVAWSGGSVPLLVPIRSAGALLIGLSDPAVDVTLLFRLAPPPGGWPTATPRVVWAQAAGPTDWNPLTPLRDSTHDLRNTGIVSLTLDDQAVSPVWLSVSVESDAAGFPMLAGLVTNAATATWVGPGGAEGLGTPLPAGTITKPVTPLPRIGSIDQPMPSSGGAPRDEGAAFEEWLAERLRHKDRGIQSWDYSNLLLAAFPSLWQVAVVPASDGGGADRAPGNVLVVAVPGPQTPDVADPTVPTLDSTMRADIADFLAARISPFIQLTVTNPPYLRITVHADLKFTDADSVQANIARLNDELIQYLSPWPPATLPPRPDDYYTRKEIAHFIRHRPYVHAIRTLWLTPDPSGPVRDWHYLTSALKHCLSGKALPESEPVHPPRLALPEPAPDAGEAG